MPKQKRKDKIRREIEAALKETGLDWSIEDSESMHRQVYLAGKKIGAICLCPGPRRDAKQILSKIRQRVKEVQA